MSARNTNGGFELVAPHLQNKSLEERIAYLSKVTRHLGLLQSATQHAVITALSFGYRDQFTRIPETAQHGEEYCNTLGRLETGKTLYKAGHHAKGKDLVFNACREFERHLYDIEPDHRDYVSYPTSRSFYGCGYEDVTHLPEVFCKESYNAARATWEQSWGLLAGLEKKYGGYFTDTVFYRNSRWEPYTCAHDPVIHRYAGRVRVTLRNVDPIEN